MQEHNAAHWTQFEPAGRQQGASAVDISNEVIERIEQTLVEEGDKIEHGVLAHLGAMLYKRFEYTGSSADESRAIELLGWAVSVVSEDDDTSSQAVYLRILGAWLCKRCQQAASGGDGDGDGDGSVVVQSGSGSGIGNGESPSPLGRLGVLLGVRGGIYTNLPSTVGVPEGETIYANTPQHHGTVQLLQLQLSASAPVPNQ